MTRRPFAWMILAAVGADVVVAVACSSSTAPKPKLSGAALAGAYTLDTLTTFPCGGCSIIESPPNVRGTLQLTKTTYKVYAVRDTGNNGPGDTVVVVSDSGTYSVSDSTLVETSATGQSADTATASLRSHNDVLDINVTGPAQARASFVWFRTP